ncbi:MAG: pyridoxamine 5'-phosphate oxidase family protein [Rhizobiaceae bacterium]|nr:pyridoxamine 5'-phosphate oxidase family protein [Rhizobiaceae bacterium]MCV0408777.1 pyridoxamine 5'-phosphate oxidase family protein [Rhizobiaceae bacterium]
MPKQQMDFDTQRVLVKPLMAHLASLSSDGPRDSPVWFLWEDDCLWLIGTSRDSFVRRLEAEPRCAVGIVDFDVDRGILMHVGIRGLADVGPMQPERLHRLLARYLGPDPAAWNAWFKETVVEPLDVMVRVTPSTMVAKDVSYFLTGPELASLRG